MSMIARVLGGEAIGDFARPFPARAGRHHIAGLEPFRGAHVPAVRGREITCGLEVRSDQSRVLVDGHRA